MVGSIWWSNSADFWPINGIGQGLQAIGKKKSKICSSSCRSGNDQETYDQMEQNLMNLSQGKSPLLSIESLLSAGQDFYGGGEF